MRPCLFFRALLLFPPTLSIMSQIHSNIHREHNAQVSKHYYKVRGFQETGWHPSSRRLAPVARIAELELSKRNSLIHELSFSPLPCLTWPMASCLRFPGSSLFSVWISQVPSTSFLFYSQSPIPTYACYRFGGAGWIWVSATLTPLLWEKQRFKNVWYRGLHFTRGLQSKVGV